MAIFNMFNCYSADIHNGKHNLGADSLKVMMTNVQPIVGNLVKTDITEIAVGGGYLAGGLVKF